MLEEKALDKFKYESAVAHHQCLHINTVCLKKEWPEEMISWNLKRSD
jgi:hypothetical protein